MNKKVVRKSTNITLTGNKHEKKVGNKEEERNVLNPESGSQHPGSIPDSSVNTLIKIPGY